MKTKRQHSIVKLGLILGVVVIESWIWARPAVAQQGAELPLCYQQTETGEMIALTHLCADLEDGLTHQGQSSRPATTSRQIPPVQRGRGAAPPSRSQSSNSINRVRGLRPQRELSSFRISLSTGIDLHYVFKGKAAAHPLRPAIDRIDQAIILVHGYTDSWRSFEEMLKQLPLDDFNQPVFALDLRGHGESSSPPSVYTQADFADDIAAFMDSLKIRKAMVIGHSMGGLIAHQFAISYPDRVNALVLISATATMAGGPLVAEIKPVIDGFDDDNPAPPDFVEEFQASTFYNAVPRALYRYVSESLRLRGLVWKETLNDLDQEDHRDQLPQIVAPTLILWGEQDTIFSREEQTELRNLIPNSTLVTFPDAGHALNVERTTEVMDAIRAFVDEIRVKPKPY